MKENLIFEDKESTKGFKSALEETLREGARRLLQQVIENEVEEFLEALTDERQENGRRALVRNGYLPSRSIQTGIGPISIRQPRVRDKTKRHEFTSAILPKYMRRTPSIESVVSALYLRGISTGNFTEALEAILGENAKGLSPTNIVRLKQTWERIQRMEPTGSVQ